MPKNFELHGHEIWGGEGHWVGLPYDELIAAYEDAMALLRRLNIEVAWSSIHKERLHDRYGGFADQNAYLLAVQFVLEKIDRKSSGLKILIADEHKEQQLRAMKMVDGMQRWGRARCRARNSPRSSTRCTT